MFLDLFIGQFKLFNYGRMETKCCGGIITDLNVCYPWDNNNSRILEREVVALRCFLHFI